MMPGQAYLDSKKLTPLSRRTGRMDGYRRITKDPSAPLDARAIERRSAGWFSKKA